MYAGDTDRMIAREIYTESIIDALKVVKKSRIRRDGSENVAENGNKSGRK